jgi:histone H3/H4
MGAQSRDALTSFVNDNPLLVAGIGAAVGAFIAASIPSSEAENRMFGAGSEKLKDKAREAAAQGIEQAGNIVAEAAGSVATAAAREGIDAAGVQRALNTVADSVRKVADRGLETALGATPPSGQQRHSEQQPSQQPNTQRNAT